jgi:4-oxalocrotonate tautomerase
MPLIHVTMLEGRTAEQKRALLEAITRATQDTLGVPLDLIRVWVTDVPSDQFMTAGVMKSDSRPAAPPPPPADPVGEAPAEAPGTPPGPPIDPIAAGGGPGVLP